MSRRFVVAIIVIWSLSPLFSRSANAQTLANYTPVQPPPVSFMAALANAPVDAVSVPDPTPQVGREIFRGPKKSRNWGFLPLHITTAVLQISDVHSTIRVLRRGGAEANPLLQKLVDRPAAFVAVKAAVAATTIFAVHKLAKGNKVAAMALSIGINSVYAMVVSHNYKLANSMR